MMEKRNGCMGEWVEPQMIRTALRVIGASEDPGGPGLVGGRLVGLREDLSALAALPAFELQSRSDRGNEMRGARG
jgi:hypothetical protein